MIGRPHGIRGALKIHLDNPDGETLHVGLAIHLVTPGTLGPTNHARAASKSAAPKPAIREIDDVIVTLGPGIITLKGVPDRNAAELLVGAQVFVRREDFVEDENAVFLVDAIGKSVVDVKGLVLGSITGFSSNGAQPLAEILTPEGKRVLVPFVPPIVKEIGAVVVLEVPEGLFNVDD
ncbi:MAG: PRC-barrel domain-containing protein [Deltaproteobacteria bacterium]|nr:PRC-barrel domain-containing protein [Deltaproteobacteria bacterium]